MNSDQRTSAKPAGQLWSGAVKILFLSVVANPASVETAFTFIDRSTPGRVCGDRTAGSQGGQWIDACFCHWPQVGQRGREQQARSRTRRSCADCAFSMRILAKISKAHTVTIKVRSIGSSVNFAS